MSATPEADAPPKKGKKKLIIIALAGVLVVGAAGAGGFIYWSRAKAAAAAAEAEAAGEGGAPAAKAEASKPKTPPTFLPLDNMVVNLADPGGDRYAQVGITLEVVDQKTADEIKVYMPTIRNGILLAISQRSADELLAREGKEKLAQDIMREVSRPLGFPYEPPPAAAEPGAAPAPARKPVDSPLRAVLFSSFIVQ